MNENYKIIADSEELERFVEWLPMLTLGERFYVSSLARRKYCPLIASNNQQLKRFLTKKEDIFSKIRQLEIPLGSYTHGNEKEAVPQEALALYMCVNPRSLWNGTCNALKSLADVIARGDKTVDPCKMVLNDVKASCSRKIFVVFDIDEKNDDLLKKSFDICGEQAYIETRGGYHILVDPKTIPKENKKWYPALKEFSDICGDEMSPVPGCTQGGFTVKLFPRL